MSPHINEHIEQTCCLGRGRKTAAKLKYVNSLHLLFTAAAPRLTSTVFDLVSALPLASRWNDEHLCRQPACSFLVTLVKRKVPRQPSREATKKADHTVSGKKKQSEDLTQVASAIVLTCGTTCSLSAELLLTRCMARESHDSGFVPEDKGSVDIESTVHKRRYLVMFRLTPTGSELVLVKIICFLHLFSLSLITLVN